MFDPGYSTGDGGTSYGLSILRRIVEAPGGTWNSRTATRVGRFEISEVEFLFRGE